MRHLGSTLQPRRGRRIRLARALLLLLSAACVALVLIRASPPADDPRRDPSTLRSATSVGDQAEPFPGAPEDLFVEGEAEEGEEEVAAEAEAEEGEKEVAAEAEAEEGEKEVAAEAEDGEEEVAAEAEEGEEEVAPAPADGGGRGRTCATVEEMGKAFKKGSETESLRVREVIKRHFDLHGAARVRGLPPHQFCRQGFVIGKASEAGFGNEMYKILTAAALSVMLNRSLIIGQTRGFYPFGEYISYSNVSFTLREVKQLWRQNDCAGKYGRKLVMRIDSFGQPTETRVLCSDWRVWKQPIIWFQRTTDAVAIQFFLKNIHPRMKNAASILFGQPESIQSRPNVFGELMRVVISPAPKVKEAVDWVLKGADPDVVLHMRMLTNRSVRAIQAALRCIKRALHSYQDQTSRPRVVLVSDTPSFVKDIMPDLAKFAKVLHFNYKLFEGNISSVSLSRQHQSMDFRARDWGPAPRWVAFVDFFLASRAKHAVVSGAHRRVGTTYAQLIAALAAANQLGGASNSSTFSFFSSFQSNLLADGLGSQGGWGHIWNRFAGPLSCRNQRHQCALTPLLPSAWWDGEWQSPIPRDIRRLRAYGVHLSDSGEVIESTLQSYCRSTKNRVRTIPVFGQCKKTKCS